MNFRRLLSLAQDGKEFRPGQIRLVAWLEDEIPGLAITPAAPQSRFAAMVVVDLDSGRGDEPRADVNAPGDVEKLPDVKVP